VATSELGDAAPAPAEAVVPVIGSIVPWWLPLLRAAVAIAAAAVITFTGGHSAQYGLIVFTAWMLATAATDVVAWRVLPIGIPRLAALGRAIVGVLGALLTGLAALGALGEMHDVERAAVLGLTAAGTLLVGGMLDAGVGVKTKGVDAFSRDWSIAGLIQVIAAIAIMFVPPGFEHRYQVEDVEGLLTGAIIIVGLLGVTAAILGVLLAIAGVSLRSTRRVGADGAAPDAEDAAAADLAPEAEVADGDSATIDGADRS